MDKIQAAILTKMRHEAKLENKPVHVYPIAEEKIHRLGDLTQEILTTNLNCAFSPTGQLCFCEPDVEDYSEIGGGQLIIHRQVSWQ